MSAEDWLKNWLFYAVLLAKVSITTLVPSLQANTRKTVEKGFSGAEILCLHLPSHLLSSAGDQSQR